MSERVTERLKMGGEGSGEDLDGFVCSFFFFFFFDVSRFFSGNKVFHSLWIIFWRNYHNGWAVKSFYTRAYLLASVLDLRRGKILENVRRHSRDRKLDFSHDESSFRDVRRARKKLASVFQRAEKFSGRGTLPALSKPCADFTLPSPRYFEPKKKKEEENTRRFSTKRRFVLKGNRRSCTRSRTRSILRVREKETSLNGLWF